MAFTEYLIGKRERMSWIAETSWATGGTMSSGEIVGLNTKIEPDWSQGWQEILAAGADDRLVQSRVTGPKQLPYKMLFTPVNWRWLKYLMAVADADDSGTKTHTFTMRNTILSYKLEWAKRHTTNHVLTVIGNAVKSATISFAKSTGTAGEGFIQIALDCVGQSDSQGSSVTSLSNISLSPFQFRHVKLTIDGNEITEVNNGELTIDNGIDEEDSRYANSTLSRLLGEPIPKTFRISGRFNVNLKDKTYYDLWNNAVTVPGTCTLLLDRDGTGNDQILFTFNTFYLLNAIPPTNLDGVTNADIVIAANSFTSVVARDAITTY